ncbi:MAG: CHRD domain-containing protein [Nitrococcus mobilis]|nr:CHRD domain-containing protein [Nitrococcus mobilis]
MKAFLMMLLSVLSWSALNHAQAVMVFEANLSGDQEVPPVTSLASGSAELALNDAQTELAILISLAGLDLDGNQTPGVNDDDVVAAHIHRAPAGTNGDVVFGFISPNNDTNNDLVIDAAAGTIFSVWDLGEGNSTTLAAELPNLLNEGLYLNIHTPSFPGGEIRGQILPVVAISEPAIFALFGVGLFGLSLSATAALRRA